MADMRFAIPKLEFPVVLWVYPEGRAQGTMFLAGSEDEGWPAELPSDVLNHPEPFLVFRCALTGELRFYSKQAVMWVAYVRHLTAVELDAELTEIAARLWMMDGTMLDGVIREALAAERRRLYDYINTLGQSFLRLYEVHNDRINKDLLVNANWGSDVDRTAVCMVNKAYIVRVASLQA